MLIKNTILSNNCCFEYKIREVENKAPNRSGLVTTTVLDTKVKEVQNKIPGTSDLVTTAVLITKIRKFDNKIPNISGLVKKADYNIKWETLARKAE